MLSNFYTYLESFLHNKVPLQQNLKTINYESISKYINNFLPSFSSSFFNFSADMLKYKLSWSSHANHKKPLYKYNWFCIYGENFIVVSKWMELWNKDQNHLKNKLPRSILVIWGHRLVWGVHFMKKRGILFTYTPLTDAILDHFKWIFFLKLRAVCWGAVGASNKGLA